MNNKIIIDNIITLAVKNWLKSKCSYIDFQTFKIVLNKKVFGKIDELYLEAKNVNYQNLYFSKLIIKTCNFFFKFNYKNHLIYFENLIINSLLTIDNRSLENLLFDIKWNKIRIEIQDSLLEGGNISKLIIKNDLINLNYEKDDFNLKTSLSLNLIDNSIFLENIINKKSIRLTVDKNIKFKNFKIKNQLIIIDLKSKVILDD